MRFPLGRLLDALASVRLAVVTMMALGAACAVATFYEASHGTAATHRLFYGAPWFTGLLALLAVNILLSTVKRYPWSRHHTGFVIAHAGILLLLAGSVVSLRGGLDGRLTLAEGETSGRLALTGEALHVGLPDGTHSVLPVAFAQRPPVPGTPLALPGTNARLVVEEYQPHARLGEVWAEAVEGQSGRPALQLTIAGAVEPQAVWLMAGDPDQSHLSFGPVLFAFHGADDDAEAASLLRTSSDHEGLVFVLRPDGSLQYALSTRKVAPSRGPLPTGAEVDTPWLGVKVRVDRLLRKAVRHQVATRLPPPARDEDRTPAVRLRVETGAATASRWLAFSETHSLMLPDGEAHLGYGPQETALPFRVSLLHFRAQTYPGSRMPASYESRVRVDDPELGPSVHLISMNHPLHHRGYTFFQASYVEGEPMTSILAVSRAPGLPMVYVGTTLIALGVLWMSFFKRWVARRQARRALEARGLAVAAPTYGRV